MYSGQEVKLVHGDLLWFDSELMAQFPLCSSAHALNRFAELGSSLAGDAQGVRAAGIGPQVGERDLFRGALL